MNLSTFWGGVTAPYEIEQSLRFDGSSYLYWTPGSAGNRRTSTFSAWFKPTTTGGEGVLINATGYTKVAIDAGGNDHIWFADYDGSTRFRLETSASLRDPSAWYHVVAVVDTTNATASDRLKLYINGVRATAFDQNTLPSQNFDTDWANNVQHRIGADTNPFYFSGYMAECHFVDGTALDPTSFGEYDDNGVWRPKRYTGSYGTNGFYLKFDPSATNGIGHDHSGNGNNFTATGFTTSGTGTDVLADTPTNNFCTWNPLDNTGVGLENGNLDFNYTGAKDCGGTFAFTSGKWYWEIEVRLDIGQGGQPLVHGIHNASVTSDFLKQAASFYTDEISAGLARRYANGSSAATVTVPSSLRAIDIGDYVQCAYDADSGKVWFGVNNTWMDGSGGTSGNPGAGSNPVFTMPDTSIPMTPWRSHAGLPWNGFTNFGQRDYQYTPPTGFKSVCTANLPAPDIADGSQYFQNVLWSGDGATSRNITTNFSPDFAIIKQRNDIYGFGTYDIVRGGGKFLRTDSTDAETTNPVDGYVSAFNSTSVTLAKGSYGWNVNGSGYTYVGWFWNGGGTGSSNTNGSITSTVSANPTAGCSIVSYTGTGTAGTVGHGLGVAPAVIWVKNRDSSAAYWPVYHHKIHSTSAPETLKLELNSAAARATADFWNNTAPTSTVFSVKDSNKVNSSGEDFIAYCFAEVEDYSKFGYYVGNGSSDGPFVYCGFKPAFVMTKDVTAHNWEITDSARDTYNVANKRLFPSNATSESSSVNTFDFLSNGFKVRGTHGGNNTNGNTHIFMAFAENPFGGEGVSPATAR